MSVACSHDLPLCSTNMVICFDLMVGGKAMMERETLNLYSCTLKVIHILKLFYISYILLRGINIFLVLSIES